MCKFNSREDPDYQTVANVFKSMAEKLQGKRAPRQDHRSIPLLIPVIGKEFVEMKNFALTTLCTRYPDREAPYAYTKAEGGTCDWVFGSAEYTQWETQDGQAILWIHGNQGQ
jgi:hypothetical protein